MQEKVTGITGQLLYFTLLLLLSLATIAICVTKTIKSGKFHSRFFLPAAWAAYNAVGPLLFFCAALMKKTKSLEMAMHSLCTVSGSWHEPVQLYLPSDAVAVAFAMSLCHVACRHLFA